jgi:hypothetical protein
MPVRKSCGVPFERRQESTGRVVEIAVDYIIEGHRGQTVLRVVHSGFSHGAEWDAEVDSIRRGWQSKLRGLRHYLTRHRGTPRRVAWALEKTSLPVEECYARLMGPAGLVREGSIAGLRPGDPYRLVAATGDIFEGEVHTNAAPWAFGGTAAGLKTGWGASGPRWERRASGSPPGGWTSRSCAPSNRVGRSRFTGRSWGVPDTKRGEWGCPPS